MFSVNMAASYEQMGNHVVSCNQNFRENIMQKVQYIRLGHKDELNKWVSLTIITTLINVFHFKFILNL